jgi:hypothetical protein
MTEEICSSETSVDFQRNTRRYIPEDSVLSQTPYLDLIMRSRSAGHGICLHIVGFAVAVGDNTCRGGKVQLRVILISGPRCR